MDETDLKLGKRLLKSGNIGGALAAFQRAITQTPYAPEAHYGLGVALHACKQPIEAARAFERTTELEPKNFAAYNNLGIALMAQGSNDAAIGAFEQSLALYPENASAWYNLGNAYRGRGEPAYALDAYRRAITLDAGYVKARNNLGALLLEQGNPSEALVELRAAVALAPRFAEALNNKGLAEWQQGNLGEATQAFREAVANAPAFVDASLNLSEVLKTQDHVKEAESILTRAREHAPEHVGLLGKLAALLEETGSSQNAEKLIRRALVQNPEDPFLNLTAAKCERRNGQLQAAIDRLERVMAQPADDELAGVLHKELGQLYDRVGEYARAFEHFEEGNALLARNAARRGVRPDDFMRENDAVCVPLMQTPQMATAPDASEQPIFLVGFPRSGTTLLNQILDNHPGLQTLEEKPAIDAVVQTLTRWTDIPGAFADTDSLRQLEQTYYSVVNHSLERTPNTRLVDKYPLNSLRLPLISRLFPGAKILMAVRHPCDVCLSCYMQSFKLNNAMASFFSLEQTARLYASAMQRWQWCEKNSQIDTHVVRYESLVDDFQSEVAKVLAFLGLPWDDEVTEYVDGAKRRERINTPSYHQVTQPIYRRAVYRWRHYADHLQGITPWLTPFIREFGY